jgi:hypothetical protein
MKTIFGFFSSALAGATAQSIAATANIGQTVVLSLRFTILYSSIRLLLTGWEPAVLEWAASEDEGPASGKSLELILVVALGEARGGFSLEVFFLKRAGLRVCLLRSAEIVRALRVSSKAIAELIFDCCVLLVTIVSVLRF